MADQNFRIKIPASSSNLGPGFDCFGLALELYNNYEIKVLDTSNEFNLTSNLKTEFCPNDKTNLFYKSFAHLYQKLGIDTLPGLELKLDAQIPSCGGFGSSGTAILAGLVCANEILGNRLSVKELLLEACSLEGHPDNVTASMLGGFCLSRLKEDQLVFKKINWKLDLDCLLLCPRNFRVNTQEARDALPQSIDLDAAITNLSNSALFTAAVFESNAELLKLSTSDRIHEEARIKLIPGAKEILDFAHSFDIYGATISGSGASLIIFSKQDMPEISQKAQEIWSDHNIESQAIYTKVSNSGALIY